MYVEIYTLNSDRTLRATSGAEVRKVVAVFQSITVRIFGIEKNRDVNYNSAIFLRRGTFLLKSEI